MTLIKIEYSDTILNVNRKSKFFLQVKSFVEEFERTQSWVNKAKVLKLKQKSPKILDYYMGHDLDKKPTISVYTLNFG